MKKLAITITTLCTLAATALGLAGAAAAAPTGAASAADTVKSLQAEGYSVQINGPANVPLSQCRVTSVHGLSNTNIDAAGHPVDPTQFTTVYVDVACADDV